MNDVIISGSDEYKWVGKRTVRPDGVDKVTGRAAYGADYNMAGMLYGAVLPLQLSHAERGMNHDRGVPVLADITKAAQAISDGAVLASPWGAACRSKTVCLAPSSRFQHDH